MIKKLLLLVIILLFILNGFTRTDAQSSETESTVPERFAFHDVIYPIWHSAYPAKDYAALRGFLKEIQSGAQKIYDAKLPGILLDREDKWRRGLTELKKSVEDYGKACAGTDDQALLKAAEGLHAGYEMLIRIIRPVLGELDAFHKVLYVVFHQYLPKKEFDKIKGVGDEMVSKAEAITKARLPERLKAKGEAFSTAAVDLLQETKRMVAVCKAKDTAAIEKAVQDVHAKYRVMEKIFD